ncbi:REEP5_6 [Acanthosepion pharaonis]|uniref:REEP5_6 n=1 Tax=Acanthosepion pharaonis TaxID=158019 RepID=A0A812CPW8_ACAPH|nr:REEP5_6 [Sepia pharaonis]
MIIDSNSKLEETQFISIMEMIGSLFEVFSYFLSFSFRRLEAWLTIKQKMRSLSLSSWHNSIFARDGLFFISFPSLALLKGLVTVETPFFFFDIVAFRIRRQTGPSIRLGDQFSSQFRKHISSAHMPRDLPDVLPACRPRPKLTFPFYYSFPFLLVTWSIFKKLTFSDYGWNGVIDPLSHLQG